MRFSLFVTVLNLSRSLVDLQTLTTWGNRKDENSPLLISPYFFVAKDNHLELFEATINLKRNDLDDDQF